MRIIYLCLSNTKTSFSFTECDTYYDPNVENVNGFVNENKSRNLLKSNLI